jgi:hypothetical protein
MDQVWLCGNCHSLNEIRNKRRAARETSEQIAERGTAAGLGTGKLAKDPSLMGALFAGLVESVDPLGPILWVVALGAAVAIPWRGLVGD